MIGTQKVNYVWRKMVPVKLDFSLELLLVAERLRDGLLRICIRVLSEEELTGAALNPRNCKFVK